MNCSNLKKSVIEYNTSSNSALLEICKPLKEFNVTAFFYLKHYNNKTFGLCTDLKWTMDFVENDIQNSLQHQINKTIQKKSLISTLSISEEGKFIGSLLPENASNVENNSGRGYSDFLISSKIRQKASVFYYHNDYIENFGFATDRCDADLIKFFVNNLDISQRFFIYFKEKAENILKTQQANSIYTPSTILVSQALHEKDQKRQDFINATKIKKVTINCGKQELLLSNREALILCYISRAKTAKEIAAMLSISSRTVELHIENIKHKTNLQYKSELVNLFYQNSHKMLPFCQ